MKRKNPKMPKSLMKELKRIAEVRARRAAFYPVDGDAFISRKSKANLKAV